jgi:hypothetical protein
VLELLLVVLGVLVGLLGVLVLVGLRVLELLLAVLLRLHVRLGRGG